jgi:MoxR-like ATPase
MEPVMKNGINDENSVIIENVKIYLQNPEIADFYWIGQKEAFRMMTASWMKTHELDEIMAPVLIGPPGDGKTTLACAVAQQFGRPIYQLTGTSDLRPEDLLILPVLNQDQKVVYRASNLVSAMITGGICVLDDANRMNEKSWANLVPLLDGRGYVQSKDVGIKILAHPEFRIAVTMNDDISTFNIPENIESRLGPIISVELPPEMELKEIIAHRLPFVTPQLIQAVLLYLKEKKATGSLSSYSTRDAIKITALAQKCSNDPSMTLDEIARRIVKIHDNPRKIGYGSANS